MALQDCGYLFSLGRLIKSRIATINGYVYISSAIKKFYIQWTIIKSD